MVRKILPGIWLCALALASATSAFAAVATTNITVTGAGPYSINYILAQQATTLKVNIYTAAGVLIQTLDESLDSTLTGPGKHDASGTPFPAASWDGKKSDGTTAPRGTYYAEVVSTGDPVTTPVMLSVANFARQAGASEARNAYGGDANRHPTSPLHNLGYFGAAQTNASGSQGLEVISADSSSILFTQDGTIASVYDYASAGVLTDETILLGGQNKKKLRNVKATDGTLIADYAVGKVDVRSMQAFGAGAAARLYFVDDQTPNGPLTGSIGLLDPINKTTGTPIYQTIVTQAQVDTGAGQATTVVPGTRGLVVNRAETSLWLCGGQASASGVHFLLRFDKVAGVWQQNATFLPTVATTARYSGLALSPDESILYMTVGDPNGAANSKIAAFNPATGADIADHTFMINAVSGDFQPVGITATASDANFNAQTSYNLLVSGFRTFPAAVTTANGIAVIAPTDNGSHDTTRSDFFDVVLGATAVSVTSGPTVSNLTDTSATITWGTDFRSGSTVHFGGAAGTYNMPDASSIETTTTHTVNLTGLAPGVTYFFQVESDRPPLTAGSATGSFTTTPHFRIVSETLNATTTSVALTVNTNVAGDVMAHWGDTPTNFNRPDIVVNGGLSHVMNFTGLAAGTTYYYQLMVTGTNAGELVTAVSSLTTASSTGSAGTFPDTGLSLAHAVDLVVTADSVTLPVQGVPGAPAPAPSLPAPIYDGGAVAYNGYLYSIGGSDSTGATTQDVRYIKIAADGTLDAGGWQVSTTLLPSPRTMIAAMVAAYNGRVYVVGGLDGSATPVSQASVLYAVQNPTTGDLGPWQGLDAGGLPINPFPAARYRGTATVMDGYLVVSGGLLAGVPQANNYAAPIMPDGSLGTWFDAGALNDARFMQRTVVNASEMFSIGGQNTGGAPLPTVDLATVQPMGSLTSFTRATAYPGHADSSFDLSTGRRAVAAALVSGKFVTAGGQLRSVATGDVNGTTLISFARLATDNAPQTWVDAVTIDGGAVLANPLTDGDGAAYNTTLYVVGGKSVDSLGVGTTAAGFAVADVLAIPMNPDPSDTGYATSGTLQSRVIDLGAMTNLKHLAVAGTNVSASTVGVRYRVAGATTPWSDWYTAATPDADVNGGARYFQYELVLKGGATAPTVTSVTLTTAAPSVVPLSTADVKRALILAAGLDIAAPADMTRLNVDGAGGITLLDAVKIQRTINGK